MSSTNRSNARNTHISDYYKTPVDDIMVFLNNLGQVSSKCNQGIIKGRVLDPCAGGIKGKESMSYVDALVLYGVNPELIMSIDIRDDSAASIIGDYLNIDCKDKYDTIITNPPFNLALPIIEKALDDVRKDGYVIMLLRLNFFGSRERKAFFDRHMPEYCFVHHKRISFANNKNGKKSTDSIEYAHFVWKKDYNPEFTKLKII